MGEFINNNSWLILLLPYGFIFAIFGLMYLVHCVAGYCEQFSTLDEITDDLTERLSV